MQSGWRVGPLRAAIAFGLLLAAGRPGPAPAGEGAADAGGVLPAVASPVLAIAHTPSFVGVEKGLFLKYGLDLKLKILGSGQEVAKAMQAGEVQFGAAAYSNHPIALERGFKAKMVVGVIGDATSLFYDENLAVVARPGSGIRAAEDLPGKRVGLVVGGTGDEYLRALLRRHHVPVERLQLLNVPPGNQFAALQNGTVDAIATWEPFPTQALEKVKGATLVARGGKILGYYILMAAPDELIQKQPEIVERFVLGYAAASQWTRQNPDAAAEIATRWIPGLEWDLAKRAIRYVNFEPRVSRLSLQAYDDNLKVLMENKKIRAPVPREQAFEPRFIEQAMREHPGLFRDLKPIPQ
jgi:ABC-type nitrate/sulfonate/bicarbonate transport system substrate-binding protein